MRPLSQTAAMAVLFALLTACDNPIAPASRSAKTGPRIAGAPGDQRTPLQRQLDETIAQRRARGLPVPSKVNFKYAARRRAATGVLKSASPFASTGDAAPDTVMATTVLYYDDPSQAGRESWPAVVVKESHIPGANGFVKPGDYTQMVKDKVAQRLPGIWDTYAYGQEPRQYTIEERYITIPHALPVSDPLTETSAAAQLLMGLSIPGPGIDATIKKSLEACVPVLGCADIADFEAGFQLDWSFGLRLPMNVDLTSQQPLLEGSTYTPTSVATGTNWSAEQYEQAGIVPEDGNEFLMRFDLVAGVFLDVAGFDAINEGVRQHIDRSKSFATPLGAGDVFDLPSIDVSLFDFDYEAASGSMGFTVTPELGSDRFTAAWVASGDASGSGLLTYSTSSVPVQAGPLLAIDGPGTATITLNNFQYYFTNFVIDLGAFFKVDVIGLDEKRFSFDITDFDLGNLTEDLSVGPHSGTRRSLTLNIPIENVPPTAEIDRTGTAMINGVATFLSPPSEFRGTARDPGRDDLTLSWDWDDGAPSPDVSTTYPVPHVVTDHRAHSFDKACLYNVGFRAVDDDQASAEDHVSVLVLPAANSNRSRLDGYWQHEVSQNGGTDFDAQGIACLLKIASHMSRVFNEARDLSTLPNAYTVLNVSQNQGSAREQLDRELLVLWLNFANGVFGYTEPVDTDGDGVVDLPFNTLMTNVENARLNASTTEDQLKGWTRVLHTISLSRVGK